MRNLTCSAQATAPFRRLRPRALSEPCDRFRRCLSPRAFSSMFPVIAKGCECRIILHKIKIETSDESRAARKSASCEASERESRLVAIRQSKVRTSRGNCRRARLKPHKKFAPQQSDNGCRSERCFKTCQNHKESSRLQTCAGGIAVRLHPSHNI